MNTLKPSKPKGRPKCFERREALSCALQVFYEKGYEATSIAELGTAMNMKPPSLYNAFGDKEKLFIEVLDFYHTPYLESVKQIFSNAKSTHEAIKQLFEKSKHFHCDKKLMGCLVANATINVSSEGSPIANKITALHETNETIIYTRLLQGQKLGDLPSSLNITKLSRYICGVLLGAAAIARGQKSPAVVEDLLEQGYQGFLELVRKEERK